MISVEEALERVLSYVSVLDSEEKPILQCLGQVLDEEVISTIDIPPADNSAMDGYAIRAEDATGASPSSPVYLNVIGEVKAGDIAKEDVGALSALRIMTGAPIPHGADSVVRFEDTDEALRRERPPFQIGIFHQATKGQNIRRSGEDITRGQLVLIKGTVLRPAEIGVLASLGKETARVIRRPSVASTPPGSASHPAWSKVANIPTSSGRTTIRAISPLSLWSN